ncbi:hypothetical protein C3747_11g345 [Trypanosoma cruzi]|uniref:Phosducin domain-containing protein n=2 Tax=Trypanosoma cruzi TaxID=5693 RepID=Q4CYY7_TRYCC|nr:hypothetical protein, conserved [Trypanosoma cruzi]EAN85493.1 hypothetical protein, conserved [Trypanosoma cruzi]PWV19178.1 hypothetical protein C3747_11g345 [Trypanosoma cruzi]RNC47814.1 hypothetical protein TcCL_NonESM02238 [Trypanosoma cruzi]|eukprot:XP_807344.1 hypothetical protein [Trypanosoma cruzi strain CL Brener]
MVERTADQRIRTTEWEDIQYRHGNRVGNYATNELEIIAQKIADENVNACLKVYDPNEERVRDKMERGGYEKELQLGESNTGGDTADNVMDDDDEDEVLLAFRRKRMAELRQQQESQRFGVLRHISGSDYMSEVTESSAANWVIALLVKPGNSDSEKLLSVMRVVAQRNREVKFLSMISTEAIKNFPDRHLPCVLFYKEKKLQQQLTELTPWKSKDKQISLNSVERVLHRYGVIRNEEFEAEEEED